MRLRNEQYMSILGLSNMTVTQMSSRLLQIASSHHTAPPSTFSSYYPLPLLCFPFFLCSYLVCCLVQPYICNNPYRRRLNLRYRCLIAMLALIFHTTGYLNTTVMNISTTFHERSSPPQISGGKKGEI